MTIINTVKAGLATLALVSTAANADVLYFNDFDSNDPGGYTFASDIDGTVTTNSGSANWRVHDGTGTEAGARPGTWTAATGNMVGHNDFYSNKEKSIFTFSVDATGYNNLSLMFDWGAILRDSTYDGVSLIAYTGTLNTSPTGSPASYYTLLVDSTG